MNELLEVKNIRKYYIHKSFLPKAINGNSRNSFLTKAVDDVSFDVKENECFGILGETGSGKTTLIRTLLRLTPPTGGEALFMGKNVFEMSKDEISQNLRKNIRMIFQHPDTTLNPNMKIGRGLDQALRITSSIEAKEREEKIIEKLSEVQLSNDYLDKYPYELSGGEKRRIGICRALLTDPKIIFADEPVSGIDVSMQESILKIFESLRNRGTSLVIISHDIRIVQILCDRIGVMYKGKLVEIGPSAEITPKLAKHPYTKALLLSDYGNNGNGHQSFYQKLSAINTNEFKNGSQIINGCSYGPICLEWRERGKPAICQEREPILTGNEHKVACHLSK